MKKHYNYFILTNLPSFYKLNLYNELQKHCEIFVLFTGTCQQERKANFFSGTCSFDNLNMSSQGLFQKIWTTLNFVLKVDYDTLLIGGWDEIPYWIAALLSKKKKNAVVIESSIFECKTRGIRGLIKRIFAKRMKKAYVPGRTNMELARNLGISKKDIVITRSVGIFNTTKQPTYTEKCHIRKFLYVGRFSEEKNLHFLIKVFNKLPNMKLSLVGYGHLEGELRSIANENIKFLGAVNNETLPSIYQAHDVFILPSTREPWGLVVEEALNNGLPVLVSNLVGCAIDLVMEKDLGCIFDPFDIDNLEKEIIKISTPSLYNYYANRISLLDFDKIKQQQIDSYLLN